MLKKIYIFLQLLSILANSNTMLAWSMITARPKPLIKLHALKNENQYPQLCWDCVQSCIGQMCRCCMQHAVFNCTNYPICVCVCVCTQYVCTIYAFSSPSPNNQNELSLTVKTDTSLFCSLFSLPLLLIVLSHSAR